MPFTSESGRKAGQKSKRGISHINKGLRDKFRSLIDETISNININDLSTRQKIDLLKTITPYVISKTRHVDEDLTDEREFVIEIIGADKQTT
jgi:hypothetical protein